MKCVNTQHDNTNMKNTPNYIQHENENGKCSEVMGNNVCDWNAKANVKIQQKKKKFAERK